MPKIVTIDRCELTATPMPDRGPVREVERCIAALGAGAVCYEAGEAWRLKALITALRETWQAVRDCEAGS